MFFGYADQDKTTYGLGYKPAMKRNVVDNDFLKAAPTSAAQIVRKSFK